MPADFFDRSEEEMIQNYDSRKTQPQLIFLGLDEEKKEGGLTWKIYAGTPYFALDVTPSRGSAEQQAHAKEVVKIMEGKGLTFLQTRMVMTLPADEGTYTYHV